VFREFVVLCRRLDLFGRELLAVDGTRIKAANNKDRNFTRGSLEKFIAAADERLDDYLRRLDAGDIEEAGKSGSRVKNLAEKIEALRTRAREILVCSNPNHRQRLGRVKSIALGTVERRPSRGAVRPRVKGAAADRVAGDRG
jgi:hypothetical protein